MEISEIQQDLWEYLSETRRPLALYGTGDGADKIIAVLENHGLKDLIAAVFASDGFVRDRSFHGFRVLSYDECCRTVPGDFIVLVCFGSSRPEVLSQVDKIASERELYVPDVPVYGNTLFSRSFYEANKKSMEEIFSLLSDDISRNCYKEYINYKLSGKLSLLKKCESGPEDETALLKNVREGCYIDLGAYYGDTLKYYLDRYPFLKKAVAVEPESHSFRKLQTCAEELESMGFNITCINALAGGRTGTELVSASRVRGTRALPNSNAVLKKVRETQVITVDSLGTDNVSFIKFDVEGSELEALEGARKTILRDRPVMKTACYHRSEDVFTLVKKVLEIRDDYKIYMRHTGCIPGWDTDFYFV